MTDSIKATAFFSRPFEKRLSSSVALIETLCRGIDVETVCVDRPGSDVPAAEANSLIKDSQFLIALCTKVYKVDGQDKYLTSTAVREEIAAAQALGKRVIFFFEKGVAADGFARNRATSYDLDNAESLTNKDIQNILYGVHKTKLQSVSLSGDVFHASGVKNFHISKLRSQIELRNTSSGLLWEYTTEKHFQFESEHDLPITSAAYCMQQMKGCKSAPLHRTEYKRNGSPVTPNMEILQEPGFVEIKSRLSPLPLAGDKLLVRDRFQSPFLGPIYADNPLSPIHIRGKRFNAYDGLAVVHRIQSLHMKFILPEDLGVASVSPVVATFSKSLDYINDDEIDRISSNNLLTTETFDGSFIATLNVDRPMYQYFYGIAWILPERTDAMPSVAEETTEWIL